MSKVSLIVPVYNCSQFIEEMILSCLNQTYHDFEVLFYDDCSTDTSADIIKFYMDKDSRIKIWQGDKNRGIVYSLNFLLRKCTGEYVARADADDILIPDRIEKQISYLMSSHYDLVSCSCVSINENGEFLREVVLESSPKKLNLLSNFKNPVFHTWLCKKSLYDKIGFYRFAGVEDFDFITRVIDGGFTISNIPDYFGMKIRIRNGNTQSTKGCVQRLMFNYVLKVRTKKNEAFTDELLPPYVLNPNLFFKKTYSAGLYFTQKSNNSKNIILRYFFKFMASLSSPLHFQFYYRELIAFIIKRFL